MEDIHKDYAKIQDYLYEAHMQITMSADFHNLVKLKNVDDELRETLILLHSNYKAEFQAIKNHNFRVLLSVVDIQSTAFSKLVNEQVNMNGKLDTLVDDKKSKIKSRLITLALVAVVGTFTVLVLYLIIADKEAGKILLELVKSLVSKI